MGGANGQFSRALDARALFGLSAEAGRGQLVRGGRSWPPDWKAGMGAVIAGKITEGVGPGCPRDGTVPTIEAMQQSLAQKWQIVGCPPEEVPSSGTSLA